MAGRHSPRGWKAVPARPSVPAPSRCLSIQQAPTQRGRRRRLPPAPQVQRGVCGHQLPAQEEGTETPNAGWEDPDGRRTEPGGARSLRLRGLSLGRRERELDHGRRPRTPRTGAAGPGPGEGRGVDAGGGWCWRVLRGRPSPVGDRHAAAVPMRPQRAGVSAGLRRTGPDASPVSGRWRCV